MDSTIEKLYAIFPAVKSPDDGSEKRLQDEYLVMAEQIKDALGLEFAHRFAQLKSQVDEQDDLSAFHRGFCLGARLMLEVLRPA